MGGTDCLSLRQSFTSSLRGFSDSRTSSILNGRLMRGRRACQLRKWNCQGLSLWNCRGFNSRCLGLDCLLRTRSGYSCLRRCSRCLDHRWWFSNLRRRTFYRPFLLMTAIVSCFERVHHANACTESPKTGSQGWFVITGALLTAFGTILLDVDSPLSSSSRTILFTFRLSIYFEFQNMSGVSNW